MIFQKSKFARAVGTVCAASVASSPCLPATSKAAANTAMLPSIYHLLLNSKPKAKAAPNFITIVVDDMGYSDFGFLGGEIPTPNIDALADNGIKLTSFYAAPASTPSRAMLFTGIDSHLVGIGRMRRFHNEQEGEPGYEDYLNFDYKPFFQVLNEGGYYTMMTGKWDVGGNAPLSNTPQDYDPNYDPNNPDYPKLFQAIQEELQPLYPINRGFNATRGLLLPGGDVHFSNLSGVDVAGNAVEPGTMVPSTPNSPLPLPLAIVPVYTENGQAVVEGKLGTATIKVITGKNEDGTPIYGNREVPKFPRDFYSTDYYTDMAMEMLDNRDTSKPFYLNVSYIAPHTPLQAPTDLREKYQPTYAQGWDVLIEQRFNKMMSLGLLPEGAEVPPRPDDIPAWDDLTQDQKDIEARRMAVYAGMIEKIDDNIGRLVQRLKDIGEYENTVILVMSDNGAERGNAAFNAAARKKFIENNSDQSYANMGNWNSYLGMSKGWARVQNAPRNMYKGSTFDGGVRTAAFVHYPNAQVSGIKYDGITSIMDIAPTLLEMAGLPFDAPDPVAAIDTNPADPYTTPTSPRTDRQYGCSMAGLFDAGTLENDCSQNRMIGWEVDGAKGFRWDRAEDLDPVNGPFKGQWKLSMTWGEGEKYYFFNLAEDIFERHELDENYPTEPRNVMKGWVWDAYLEYARVNNVIPVGNPIINDIDPTRFTTYEGFMQMPLTEQLEAMTPTEMLSPLAEDGKKE